YCWRLRRVLASANASSIRCAASDCISLSCVGIQIQCCCDARMPQSFHGNFRMHPACEKLGCVAVAQIVKSHAGNFLYSANETTKFVGQALRQVRSAVRPSTNQCVGGLPNAKCK